MDVKNKPVVITDVTMKPVGTSIVYMLETSGGKFSFFNKKQDGSETKAYSQFVKFGFKKGDSVEIAYTEKVSDKINSFTGKPFVNYSVMFFVTADEHTPATPKVYNTPTTSYADIPTIQIGEAEDKNDYLLMINKLSSRLSVVEKFLEIPSNDDGVNLESIPF